MKLSILLIALLFVAGYVTQTTPATGPKTIDKKGLKTATFAGGCFWCMEPPFEKIDGVVDVVSGYAGGAGKNPTYEDYGKKGYIEAVQIKYDPKKISYQKLLDVFWRQIDPTDSGGQFNDRGFYYTTAIFYHDQEQKQLAEKSKRELGQKGIFKKPIVTRIVKATSFYKAEDYHQDYYKRNKLRYKFYRFNSGRDRFLKEKWGNYMEEKSKTMTKEKYSKPADDVIKKRLTPLQYKVTQKEGTERPFNNEYWDNKKEGIYVDIVSGEPLFSSNDKFKSGTGWPSFTRPLESQNVVEKEDRSLFGVRTEVRSKYGDSHLGHVFEDGPPPTGLRYCINSAALRFVPKENFQKEGYEEYLGSF